MKRWRASIFAAAFKCSVPVLLGYLALGMAFGLFLAGAGYPWWLAPVMSVVMYAGMGQFVAVGLFTAGVWEAALVQLVVNARHMAYGFTMMKRFEKAGPFRYYLIFALTDETFALLSPMFSEPADTEKGKYRFMFYVSLLNQCYWITGALTGALAGSFIPFDTEGVGFALTALFIVLMIDQIFPRSGKARNLHIFAVSALAGVLGVILFPERTALLFSLGVSLVFVGIVDAFKKRGGRDG